MTDKPPVADREREALAAKPVPLIHNLQTPHVWTQEAPGGECARCGATWPEKDSCP